MGSITKAFTASGIMKLVERGEIVQDAFKMYAQFDSVAIEKVFNIMQENKNADLCGELQKIKLEINHDMILHKIGQKL